MILVKHACVDTTLLRLGFEGFSSLGEEGAKGAGKHALACVPLPFTLLKPD